MNKNEAKANDKSVVGVGARARALIHLVCLYKSTYSSMAVGGVIGLEDGRLCAPYIEFELIRIYGILRTATASRSKVL